MTDSHINVAPGGTTFVGPHATALFAAIALRRGLLLYAKSKMLPNRMWTPTRMLEAATRTTGHAYKRGQYAEAAKDLADWIATMKAALPVKAEGKP